ncbi:ribosome hibernation-promoting factor, HPF/YfiA family [Brassicibacter mesophilus]|uniref:ribosome hibernation-promoting factor, HPF/YfiA family n=1 Tax=Brassicibacter mesophilus TaxID=745119 RepID=UPI003D2425BF
MKFTISGKNMEVTDALKDVTEKKLSKLDKYFVENVPVDATLSVEKNRQIIEVTIPFSGAILRAEEATEDMYNSIDNVVDVLERQIRKHKTKLQKRNKGLETIRFENIQALPPADQDKEPSIVKTKKFALKPMDEEEAVLQMELLRHSFFVFRNADTDEVNVVYKRKDGNYGLIEPQF